MPENIFFLWTSLLTDTLSLSKTTDYGIFQALLPVELVIDLVAFVTYDKAP